MRFNYPMNHGSANRSTYGGSGRRRLVEEGAGGRRREARKAKAEPLHVVFVFDSTIVSNHAVNRGPSIIRSTVPPIDSIR